MTRRLVPPELLDSVVSYFKPQRVILFGSAARGEAGPDIAELVAVAENWTAWAVAYRYPLAEVAHEPEPDDDELQRALATIDALAARLRAEAG